MREILFKAKRLDNGEWIQGYLFLFWGKAYILWGMVNESPDMIEVDPETICQYTGLVDKNGNKIWENDVVNIDSYSYMEPEDSCYGVVRYSNAKSAFCLDSGGAWIPMYECTGSYTTIYENFGSIFDNPDLLER